MKFTCPHCEKVLNVKDEYAGKKAKCPGCGESVVIEAPAELGLMPEPAPSVMASSCPNCGEVLSKGALTCRSCGADLRTGRIVRPTVSRDPVKFNISLLGGAVAGTVCAGIWAAILVFSGYELGIVAWGIGGVIGFTMSRLTPERSMRLAIAAQAIIVFTIITAKIFVAEWGAVKMLETEIMNNEAAMAEVLAPGILEGLKTKKDDPEIQKALAELADKELISLSDPEYLEKAAPIFASIYIQNMSEEEKRELAKEIAVGTLEHMNYFERMGIGGIDFFWIFLGIATAYPMTVPQRKGRRGTASKGRSRRRR